MARAHVAARRRGRAARAQQPGAGETEAADLPAGRRVSLSGDSGGLDSVSPSFDVAPQQFCQVFGAPVLWRRHARSEVLHSLAHGRCVKCLGRCLVEAADNRLGRSLREEKSVPTVDGHFCQALLPGGRKIRQPARAAGRSDWNFCGRWCPLPPVLPCSPIPPILRPSLR
jgi:hypothetical protein